MGQPTQPNRSEKSTAADIVQTPIEWKVNKELLIFMMM